MLSATPSSSLHGFSQLACLPFHLKTRRSKYRHARATSLPAFRPNQTTTYRPSTSALLPRMASQPSNQTGPPSITPSTTKTIPREASQFNPLLHPTAGQLNLHLQLRPFEFLTYLSTARSLSAVTSLLDATTPSLPLRLADSALTCWIDRAEIPLWICVRRNELQPYLSFRLSSMRLVLGMLTKGVLRTPANSCKLLD